MDASRLSMRRFFVLAAFAVWLSVLSGCGYTFQGAGSVLPPDVRKIYIPMAENNSAEPGLATTLTEALRDRFDRYGVVNVVDEIGEADAVLRLRIVRVRRDTATVTSKTDIARQFDASLDLSADLRRVSGPLLWRDSSITVSRAFGADSGVVVTSSADFLGGSLSASDLAALGSSGASEVARSQESEAFNQLCDKASQIIYNSAVAPDF